MVRWTSSIIYYYTICSLCPYFQNSLKDMWFIFGCVITLRFLFRLDLTSASMDCDDISRTSTVLQPLADDKISFIAALR